jgi:undecaprenyl-diphosphatase
VSQRTARLSIGFAALVLLGWGAGELWLAIASSTDLTAIRDATAQRTAAIEEAARVVTWAGSAAVLAPLTAICCLIMLRAGMRQAAVAFALSFLGASLLSDAIKLLVKRARPPVEHLQAVLSSSFPSGHATQASAFWLSAIFAVSAAGASSASVRAVAAVSVPIVLAVAASRVFLGVHYPGDVVAGISLGCAWTLLSWRTLDAGRGP